MTNEIAESSEKTRIAKSANFVLLYVLTDRYSSAAIGSILVLFLNLKIGYDRNTSTAIYHSYVFLNYFLPLLGSIIADSWWGQFKTIVRLTFAFTTGAMMIAVATVDDLHLPLAVLSLTGLFITTIGTGCCKPCVNTLGGDQYKSNESKSIGMHYVFHYFAYNCGSILSKFITPIFRADIKCFGGDDCYPLAFGIPGLMMMLAALCLLAGKKYLIRNKAGGNLFIKVVGCIWHAISLKFTSPTATKHEHWLDRSEEKYGKRMVMETKMILNVIALFPPLPLFWALFGQQGSRWVFQATRMDGDCGWFTIKPDQFTLVNPFIALILIPSFEVFMYPLLKRIGIKSPLQKATLGGYLAVVSFLISALIEAQLETQKLHMFWLLPQYFTMTLGEIMITIPLMHFSYTEAPESMKSVLTAFRLLTIAFGNLIVVVVAGTRMVDSQMYEFLLFAGLMFIDISVFGLLAKKYKYVNQDELQKINEKEDNLEPETYTSHL